MLTAAEDQQPRASSAGHRGQEGLEGVRPGISVKYASCLALMADRSAMELNHSTTELRELCP